MTDSVLHRGRTASRAIARGFAVVLGVLLGLVSTSGCGMRILGQRLDVRGIVPVLKSDAEVTQEAREQVALNPREPYWHYRIAQVQMASDSTAAAEASLRASLACNPFYAPALSLISKMYFAQSRHAEAIALLVQARSRPDEFPQGMPAALLAGLALHYDATGRADLARAVLAEVGSSDRKETGSAEVYVTLRGEFPESAAALADLAVDRNGKSAANHNNLGIARLRAGDPNAARRAFLAAIDRDPTLPGPYYNLAILEKYYLFDDSAGEKWFAEYRKRAADDPDRLAEVFGKPDPKGFAGQEAQP